jgi:hypothetical protein
MTQGELLRRLTSRELSEWHFLYLIEEEERKQASQASDQ